MADGVLRNHLRRVLLRSLLPGAVAGLVLAGLAVADDDDAAADKPKDKANLLNNN